MEALRRGPGGHLCRISDEQEDTTYESGVEGVLTQTAESHLTNTDSYYSTDNNEPPVDGRRKVESEQQTREDGREVSDGLALLFEHITADDVLGADTCENRDGSRDQCAPAKLH